MDKPLCAVEGCNLVVRGKQKYCRKHYVRNRRTGNPLGLLTPCQWPGCTRTGHEKFCSYHKNTKRPPGAPRGWYLMGERNPNWNGGVCEYKNHGDFKRSRLSVLQTANYICADCGGPAREVHHKDGSTSNHSTENLVPLCKKCHKKYDRPYTSKYKRLYGYTLNEMSKIYGVSSNTVLKRIKSGEIVVT